MIDVPAARTPARGDTETAARELDGVMRHLRAPVNIELNINFHPSDPRQARQAAGADTFAAALPEDALKRLLGLEPQILKWLAASDNNRLLFLSDPIAALQQVDKSLDKTFLKQLWRARQGVTEAPIDSRIRLSAVRVAVTDRRPTVALGPAKPDTDRPKR